MILLGKMQTWNRKTLDKMKTQGQTQDRGRRMLCGSQPCPRHRLKKQHHGQTTSGPIGPVPWLQPGQPS